MKSVQHSAQTHSIQVSQINPLVISGTIAKQPIKMLIDSGASLTLINSNLFYRLPYHIRQRAAYPTNNLQLLLADKSCIQVQKSLTLPITIANQTRYHKIHVVPNLWRPCIIGNDFIRKHNLQIDGGKQQIYFKNSGVVKPKKLQCSIHHDDEKEYTLSANERLKVPPFHVMFPKFKSNQIGNFVMVRISRQCMKLLRLKQIHE